MRNYIKSIWLWKTLYIFKSPFYSGLTINNFKHVSKSNSKAIVTLSNDKQHKSLWLLEHVTSTYVGVDVNDKKRYNI